MPSELQNLQATNRFIDFDEGLANRLKSDFECPVFLLDEIGIRNRLRDFQNTAISEYANSVVAVSYKTNPTRAMLDQLHLLGAFAEVVSGDEFKIAKSLNVPTEQIIFNGPCKTDQDLTIAISEGCFLNCDHEDEVDRIEAIARKRGQVAKIGIRLYFESEESWERFGFRCDLNPKTKEQSESHAHQIAKRIASSDALKLAGIHSHIGTNVREMAKFQTLGERMAEFANYLRDALNVELQWIDVGGGLAGLAPSVAENRFEAHELPSLKEYCRAIVGPLRKVLERFQSPPRLFFEPGRTLFNAYGALLVSVVGRRPAGKDGIKSVILDAGVTSLAFASKYNHPIHVCNGGANVERLRFYGPTCMEQDQVHQPIEMPRLAPGDLLLFYGVGAYSMAMACSFTHFRLGIVGWGDGDTFRWLRKPETIEHSGRLDEIVP